MPAIIDDDGHDNSLLYIISLFFSVPGSMPFV